MFKDTLEVTCPQSSTALNSTKVQDSGEGIGGLNHWRRREIWFGEDSMEEVVLIY